MTQTRPSDSRLDRVKAWFGRLGDALERGRSRLRSRVSRLPGGVVTWKVLIAVLGLAIIVLGVILLPLPGPGWLIIFVGLGLWGTEFEWAKRLLRFARRQVGRWTDWVGRQSLPVKALVGLLSIAFLVGVCLGALWLSSHLL